MASEPPVDEIVKVVQLARARARCHGLTKAVTASLLDIQWVLEQIRLGKNKGWDLCRERAQCSGAVHDV